MNVSFPNPGMNCCSESGLHKLVMRSDTLKDREFQDWVIRAMSFQLPQGGGYMRG